MHQNCPPAARKIALLVFPGFQVLDLAALTVFELAALSDPAARYETELVSEPGGLVSSSAGLALQTRALGRGHFDTLLIAGPTLLTEPFAPSLVKALAGAARRTQRVASICTGAFLAADAGLLAGRRVTTHWAHAQELQRKHPDIRMQEDRIYVQDGPVWSSAGMSACIDLALALVEADFGTALAKAVARKMVVYHRRTGGQSQFSALSELEPASDRVRDALLYARAHLREPLTVEQLAEQVHWSPRHFSRTFRQETGHSPAKAVEKLRLEAAREMIEAGHDSLARIARDSGFGDEERMRRAFLRALGKPPQALLREQRRSTAAADPQPPA